MLPHSPIKLINRRRTVLVLILSITTPLFNLQACQSFSWMLVTRTAVVPFLRPALSIQRQQSSRHILHRRDNSILSPGSSSSRHRGLLTFTSLGMSGTTDNNDAASASSSPPMTDKNEPKTGWLHKKPKQWKANDTSNDKSPSSSVASASEAATGWLHKKPKTPTTTSLSSSTNDDTPPSTPSTPSSPPLPPLPPVTQRHSIPSPPTLVPCGSHRLAAVTKHKLIVPLCHSPSYKKTITVAFSTVELISNPSQRELFSHTLTDPSLSPAKRAEVYRSKVGDLVPPSKSIVYLQGGPGFPSPVAGLGVSLSDEGSWVGKALSQSEFARVVLVDQRGTGGSTCITKQTLERLFEGFDKGERVEEVAQYVSQFRADNIVRDCEVVRELFGEEGWGAVLGQSFGGFCVLSYLSHAAILPRYCLLTGGIPPLLTPPVELYSSLFEKVKERNLMYYHEFPQDVALVKRIVRALEGQTVILPSGGHLTPRRFLQLGLKLGSTPGVSFLSLHSLITNAFLNDDDDTFCKSFLKQMDSAMDFDDNPLYFLLHESIYADGSVVTWAAQEAYERLLVAEPRNWDYRTVLDANDDNEVPLFFTGEMVFPWMTEDYAELGGEGMTALANTLATQKWDTLYDTNKIRAALSSQTRMAAAVYVDDMYVDFDACRKMTAKGGGAPLEECKVWITNEYQHSGLRDDGANIFGRLLEMVKGTVRIPS